MRGQGGEAVSSSSIDWTFGLFLPISLDSLDKKTDLGELVLSLRRDLLVLEEQRRVLRTRREARKGRKKERKVSGWRDGRAWICSSEAADTPLQRLLYIPGTPNELADSPYKVILGSGTKK